MAPERDFAPQKAEVAFFMDKTFQISFTYFGGLVAFFALSKTDFMKAVVQASGIRLGILTALVILLLNLVYVTVACACLFAILKRGLFILKHSPRSSDSKASLYIEWERFVRDDSLMPTWHKLRPLAWNIDNYYMLPLFAIILMSSAGAGWYAIGDGVIKAKLSAIILIAFYAVPVYMFYYMAMLNNECRRLLLVTDPDSPNMQRADEIDSP